MRVAIALAFVFLLAAPAFADTPDGARQRLIAAKLSPNPVFPTYLPPVLQGARADLSHHGSLFDVEYTKACTPGPCSLIVDFSRLRYGTLHKYLRYVREVRHSYRALRIGSRRVYLLHDDIHDFYMWHEQHLTYCLSRHDGVITRPSLHLLARVVASVAPLPSS